MHSDNKDIYKSHALFSFLQLIIMYGLSHAAIIPFLGVRGGVHVRSHALYAEA